MERAVDISGFFLQREPRGLDSNPRSIRNGCVPHEAHHTPSETYLHTQDTPFHIEVL